MSNALNYLVKARPEAMSAYFEFLKRSSDHLDTKTRDLISVITKVAVQTENGFRQYTARALRNGATPDEIIDAILMAFPALGLAKIVWATEILLDMNIPAFALEALGAEPEWHDLGAVEDLPDGEAVRLEAKGRGVFVYRKGEEIKVYDGMCPHQVNNIPELAMTGTRITCPKHHWAFDATTGECVEKGNRPLTELDHRVAGGRLEVFW